MSDFPRSLSAFENEALRILLPNDRIGYKPYFEFAQDAQVIGEGRWGTGDLILAAKPSPIDLTAGMQPVIAFGELSLKDGRVVTVSVHTPEDAQMEVQFSEDTSGIDASEILSAWTYSTWTPGMRDPGSDTIPRAIDLKLPSAKPIYVFAISAFHHALWVHHVDTKFNQLLPVTGFYEYLLRSQPNTSNVPLTADKFSPKSLFTHLNEFSDDALLKALMHYNTESRKFDTSMFVVTMQKKRSIFSRLFEKALQRTHA